MSLLSADRENRVNKRKQEWKEVLNAGKEQRIQTDAKVLRRDRRSLLHADDGANDDWREKLQKRRAMEASKKQESHRLQGEIIHTAKRSLELDNGEEEALKVLREQRRMDELREKRRLEEEKRLREAAEEKARKLEGEARAREKRRLALEREMAPPPSKIPAIVEDDIVSQIECKEPAEFEPAITWWDKALLQLFTSSCCAGGEVL